MEFANIGYSEEQIELLDVATNFCRERSPILSVRQLIDSDTGFDANIWDEIIIWDGPRLRSLMRMMG